MKENYRTFTIDETKIDQIKQKFEDNKLFRCIETLDSMVVYAKDRYSVLGQELLNPNLTEEERETIIRKIIVAERKFRHMIDVPDLCVDRSIKNQYSNEQSTLLTTVGILHDIGRIDEIIGQGSKTVFKNKVDHGEIGAQYLEKEGNIQKYIEEELVSKYGDLITKCVKYHGAFSIPDSEFASKLGKSLIHDIRLIDKSSIMNSFLYEDIGTVIGIPKEELAKTNISDTTYNELTTGCSVNRKKEGEEYTPNRHFMSHVGFIYGMDDYSLLKDEWVKKYLDIYKPTEKIDKERKQDIIEHAEEHIRRSK